MLQNLHTHSSYCDGRDTPREMIEAAIRLGFDSLGFSSHANSTSSLGSIMRDVDGYHKEITALKAEYSGRIKIYLGTELDRYSEGCIPDFKYDYLIGSTHSTKVGDEHIFYDMGLDVAEDAINRVLGGDSEEYFRLYYRTVAEMPSHIPMDIVGHFDLLTKYSEEKKLFDEDSRAYRSAALEALSAVREKCELFEVNTGAIGRGYRTTPYPAPFILDEMRRLDCKLILSSDCHDSRKLDCNFKETLEYIKAHGFGELYYLTDSGFVPEKI